MAQWIVPLADVVVPEDDIAAVAETYRSGWLSMGPQTEALEAELAAYTGAAHALAVTNGTAALHLICAAAGLGPGDEVITPSLTFVATVNAIAYTGATPVFADVAGLTEPWLSAAAAEAAITPRTKAIMTMSYGGHPGETAALAALARARGLVLLEDAAHAAGSRIDGRHLGTFGAAGAFSFFSNKNLAVGEGGLVVTDDDAIAADMRLRRSHGMTTLTWDRHRGHASSYDVVALGFNYRIDEPRAALARARLRRLDEENAARGVLDARYRAALADVEGIVPALEPVAGAQPAHHLFTVVLEEGLDRDGFRRSLAERGVQTSLHYPPVHRFAIHARPDADLPITDAYAARAVTLPMFATMTEEQQDTVLDAVRAAVNEAAAATTD
ncbi:MAG TPA: DegT/DnrJ/EryC1/StrS family aminotransferase [Solirubrobacteraceae bacterium]|nr:DegT/DnrJ/EryC1/StrS family aminotransferase [Solirubrobacteraceae bacterium]